MPTLIFRSETGFHPLEALAFFGAFSNPGMFFCWAYAPGNPIAAAAMLIDCINPRRDTRFVKPVTLLEVLDSEHDSFPFIGFESVFIVFEFYFVCFALLQNAVFAVMLISMRNVFKILVGLDQSYNRKKGAANIINTGAKIV